MLLGMSPELFFWEGGLCFEQRSCVEQFESGTPFPCFHGDVLRSYPDHRSESPMSGRAQTPKAAAQEPRRDWRNRTRYAASSWTSFFEKYHFLGGTWFVNQPPPPRGRQGFGKPDFGGSPWTPSHQSGPGQSSPLQSCVDPCLANRTAIGKRMEIAFSSRAGEGRF